MILLICFFLLGTSLGFLLRRKPTSSTEEMTEELTEEHSLGYRLLNVKDLKLGVCIGEGNYSSVYKGTWHNSKVAVKVINLQIDEEAEIMARLGNHPNILPFIGLARTSDKTYIVTKYCSDGSLQDYLIKKKTIISEKQLNSIILQISYALDYLHSNSIIHRDLAARNVLLDSGRIYLSDFGFSRVLTEDFQATKTNQGPIRWMAPESLGEKIYSRESDIYMLGILFWEILTRETPYGDYSNLLDVYEIIINGTRLDIPSDCPEVYQNILIGCWKTQANERIKLKEIIESIENYMKEKGYIDEIEEITKPIVQYAHLEDHYSSPI